MPSLLTRLGQLIPGFAPRATPSALVLETPDERAARVVAEMQQQLDRSRGRPAPSTGERIPDGYRGGIAGKVWFLPYSDSTTKDTPEIRAAMRLMRRDGYVKAAWEPQIASVASEDYQVQPSEEGNPEAEEQSDFVNRVIGDYLTGGMPGLVRSITSPLGSDGFSIPEKVWGVAKRGRLEGKIVLEAAKPKDPDFLRIEGDRFGNVTHVKSLRGVEAETYPITDFLYARYLTVFNEPLGEAAFRPAYGPYWMRDTVRKLRAIHHEKKMAGMLKGTYANPDDKGPLEDALRAARSATWIAVPEGTQVEAIALSTAAEPDYKSFDESLRDEIVTSIGFATLQTLMTSGAGDARGDSEVQKQTSDLAPWLLMTIVTQVINEQLIPDLIDFNFPYPAAGGYPKLSFGAVSNKELMELVGLVEAAQRIGLTPSKKYYAKALSIQQADPNDPEDQMQAGGQPPMPPGGGGFGGGFGAPPDPFGGGAMFSEGWSRPSWESFAWQAARSSTGNVKAVGTAEDAGRALYGRQAEAALARQGRTDRGESHPPTPQEKAKQLAQEREPARQQAREAFRKAWDRPDQITAEEMAGLGERMKTLTRDELRGFARNMAARVGGLKPELVNRLVAKAREKTAAASPLPGAVDAPEGGAGVAGAVDPDADQIAELDRQNADFIARRRGEADPVPLSQRPTPTGPGSESARRAIANAKKNDAVPTAKQPHEMSKEEYVRKWVDDLKAKRPDHAHLYDADKVLNDQGKLSLAHFSNAMRERKAEVQSALAAGKPVPPEVLADYPDLAPTPTVAPNENEPAPAAGAQVEPANSPQSGKARLDSQSRTGDTTPVPATPAGGQGGGKMKPEDHGYTRNKFPATYQGQKVAAGEGWTKQENGKWVTYPDSEIGGVVAHDARRKRYTAASDSDGLVGDAADHSNARGDFARSLHAGSVPADEAKVKSQVKAMLLTAARGGLMPSFAADELVSAGYPAPVVAQHVRRQADMYAARQGMEDEHTPERQTRMAADAQAWLARNGGAA
jgi:hypothetical protein